MACTGIEMGSQWRSGYGLLESKDGGETWTQTSLQFKPWDASGNILYDVAILDTKDEKTLLALTRDKIYQSLDKGLTWNIVYSSTLQLKGITIDPNDKSSMIAFGKDLLVSRNSGATWQSIINRETDTIFNKYGAYPDMVADFSYVQKHKLYVAVKALDCALYSCQMENNNGQFSLLNSRVCKPDGRHFSLFVKNIDEGRKEVIYIGTDRVYGSTGESYSNMVTDTKRGKNYVHSGINSFYTDKEGNLYVMSTGGIDKSADAGLTWGSLTNYAYNLDAASIYGFDKSQANTMMCGSIGTGVLSFFDGEWHCTAMIGEAGRTVSIDDSAGFAAGMAEVNYFTKNAGKSFEYKHAGKERVGYDFRMAFLRRSKTFYLANTHLYKKPEGKYFEVLTPTIEAEHKICAFWIDPVNEKRIWIGKQGDAGTTRDKLLYTQTGGSVWKDMGIDMVELATNDIKEICANSKGQVAVVLKPTDTYGASTIYLSDTAGTTFKNITRSLPGPDINTVTYAKGMWICGTSQGVYAYVDNTWAPLGKDFPPVAVSEVRYFEKEGTLYASTFGRGILGMRW